MSTPVFSFGHPCEHQLRRTCIGGINCPLNGYPDTWCCSFVKGRINFKRDKPCEGPRCRWGFVHPPNASFDTVTQLIADARATCFKFEEIASGEELDEESEEVPTILPASAPNSAANNPTIVNFQLDQQHIVDAAHCVLHFLRIPTAAVGRQLGQLFVYSALRAHESKVFTQLLRPMRKPVDVYLIGAVDYLNHIFQQREAANARKGNNNAVTDDADGGKKKKKKAATDETLEELKDDVVSIMNSALSSGGQLVDREDQRKLQGIFINLLKTFPKSRKKTSEMLENALAKFGGVAIMPTDPVEEAKKAAQNLPSLGEAVAEKTGGENKSKPNTPPPQAEGDTRRKSDPPKADDLPSLETVAASKTSSKTPQFEKPIPKSKQQQLQAEKNAAESTSSELHGEGPGTAKSTIAIPAPASASKPTAKKNNFEVSSSAENKKMPPPVAPTPNGQEPQSILADQPELPSFSTIGKKDQGKGGSKATGTKGAEPSGSTPVPPSAVAESDSPPGKGKKTGTTVSPAPQKTETAGKKVLQAPAAADASPTSKSPPESTTSLNDQQSLADVIGPGVPNLISRPGLSKFDPSILKKQQTKSQPYYPIISHSDLPDMMILGGLFGLGPKSSKAAPLGGIADELVEASGRQARGNSPAPAASTNSTATSSTLTNAAATHAPINASSSATPLTNPSAIPAWNTMTADQGSSSSLQPRPQAGSSMLGGGIVSTPPTAQSPVGVFPNVPPSHSRGLASIGGSTGALATPTDTGGASSVGAFSPWGAPGGGSVFGTPTTAGSGVPSGPPPPSAIGGASPGTVGRFGSGGASGGALPTGGPSGSSSDDMLQNVLKAWGQ